MNIPKPAIGSKEWADEAERTEWAFVAKMLRECIDNLPIKLSGAYTAMQIAEERSKKGWRAFEEIQ